MTNPVSPPSIGDYALIGNLRTAALVARNGSIDWFCPTRFDSPACFAALLGNPEHGRWLLAPSTGVRAVSRCYLPDTLILQTRFTTASGSVELLDYMPLHCGSHIVRELRCLEGSVEMTMVCQPGFQYGKHRARVEPGQQGLVLVSTGGGERIQLTGDLEVIGCEDGSGRAQFRLTAGQCRYLALSYADTGSDLAVYPQSADAASACAAWWRQWVSHSSYQGPWKAAVDRSLLVLKALIYLPTGAMVAAPTTSLPEIAGGAANWDYRFTWLRDASLVLDVLLRCGFLTEAREWRDWLVRAVTGSANRIKTLYRIDGGAPDAERELDWLPGYQHATPVRVNNAASVQFQLDISGELIQVLHLARKAGLEVEPDLWRLQCEILATITHRWREPDAGIWEVRGEPQHYVHSKVLAWAAFDRSIADAQTYHLSGPVDAWCQTRDAIHQEVCSKGLHPDQYFVRHYGSTEMDASLLMIPLIGFLPADDPRVSRTVEQIERHLRTAEGLVHRNQTSKHAREGIFIVCSYWLADNYMLMGRHQQANALFEQLLNLGNDLGLMAEEYDPESRCFMGNFPQSFSHLGLVNSALLIGAHEKVARSGKGETQADGKIR